VLVGLGVSEGRYRDRARGAVERRACVVSDQRAAKNCVPYGADDQQIRSASFGDFV
jgi:hypothetical protein